MHVPAVQHVPIHISVISLLMDLLDSAFLRDLSRDTDAQESRHDRLLDFTL
jgi:hypothetical protein